jgi:uncharacterized membrane protein
MTLATRYAVLGVAALVALQFLWHGWLAPPRSLGWAIAGLASLPLLAALAVLLFRGRNANTEAGIIALLYFVHGITEAWADRSVWPLGLAEAGLALWVVVASSWDGMRARFARKAPAPPPA